MKQIIFLLLSCTTFQALAYERAPYMSPWVIVADSLDTSIPDGTCVVTGYTFLNYSTPIAGGTVATLNRSSATISDAAGKYSMAVNPADSAIFFYHPEYGEIVIWNYDFKSQHRVTINFYARQKYNENQTVKKPVIYLYSDIEREITLTVEHPNITFTYPLMNTEWQVRTLADGSVMSPVDGKIYPYLFWEGESEVDFYTSSGTIPGQLLSTDTIVSFLENNLSAIGLTQKEQADFITFWAPQIIQKPYVFIQFMLDERYDENIAGIDVQPMPDSQLRVFMCYRLMEQAFVPFEYEQQTFQPFERTGFTLVEWGGTELKITNPSNP